MGAVHYAGPRGSVGLAFPPSDRGQLAVPPPGSSQSGSRPHHCRWSHDCGNCGGCDAAKLPLVSRLPCAQPSRHPRIPGLWPPTTSWAFRFGQYGPRLPAKGWDRLTPQAAHQPTPRVFAPPTSTMLRQDTAQAARPWIRRQADQHMNAWPSSHATCSHAAFEPAAPQSTCTSRPPHHQLHDASGVEARRTTEPRSLVTWLRAQGYR